MVPNGWQVDRELVVLELLTCWNLAPFVTTCSESEEHLLHASSSSSDPSAVDCPEHTSFADSGRASRGGALTERNGILGKNAGGPNCDEVIAEHRTLPGCRATGWHRSLCRKNGRAWGGVCGRHLIEAAEDRQALASTARFFSTACAKTSRISNAHLPSTTPPSGAVD